MGIWYFVYSIIYVIVMVAIGEERDGSTGAWVSVVFLISGWFIGIKFEDQLDKFWQWLRDKYMYSDW